MAAFARLINITNKLALALLALMLGSIPLFAQGVHRSLWAQSGLGFFIWHEGSAHPTVNRSTYSELEQENGLSPVALFSLEMAFTKRMFLISNFQGNSLSGLNFGQSREIVGQDQAQRIKINQFQLELANTFGDLQFSLAMEMKSWQKTAKVYGVWNETSNSFEDLNYYGHSNISDSLTLSPGQFFPWQTEELSYAFSVSHNLLFAKLKYSQVSCPQIMGLTNQQEVGQQIMAQNELSSLLIYLGLQKTIAIAHNSRIQLEIPIGLGSVKGQNSLLAFDHGTQWEYGIDFSFSYRLLKKNKHHLYIRLGFSWLTRQVYFADRDQAYELKQDLGVEGFASQDRVNILLTGYQSTLLPYLSVEYQF